MAWCHSKRRCKYCLPPISLSLKYKAGKSVVANERLFARGTKAKSISHSIVYSVRRTFFLHFFSLFAFFGRHVTTERKEKESFTSFGLLTTHLHGFLRRCWWRNLLFYEIDRKRLTNDKKSRSIRTAKRNIINLAGYKTRKTARGEKKDRRCVRATKKSQTFIAAFAEDERGERGRERERERWARKWESLRYYLWIRIAPWKISGRASR